MPHPLLTPSNTFDLSAIMAQAWKSARKDAARGFGTLRQCFASSLRYVWSLARGARSYAIWAAEQDANAAAEAARRAALPVRAREIENARTALMFAEHNDTLGSHRLIAAASARLQALQQAA